MADTILEILEEEIGKAFRQFAAKPTQSGRIQLRHDLLTIAGALEVEANNLPDAEASLLRKGITDLKALGEVALVAPKEVLITKADTVQELPKPAPAPKPRDKGLVAALFRDVVRAFKK